MNYSELKTAVTGFLHRTDLGGEVGNFIARAEATLFRELDIKATELAVTGTTTGAVIPLPAGFDRVTRVSITVGGRESSLDYFPKPEEDISTGSTPGFFSMDQNTLRLHDAPGSGYAYKLYYIPVIAPLSESVTSNWLLANAEDLYMYAAALEGARHVRNAALIDRLEALVPPLLDAVRRADERRAIPLGGALRIKPRR